MSADKFRECVNKLEEVLEEIRSIVDRLECIPLEQVSDLEELQMDIGDILDDISECREDLNKN